VPDRKPRGQPRKEINEIIQLVPVSPALTLLNIQSTSYVVTPAFISEPDVPHSTQNDLNNQDNIANQETTTSLDIPVFPNNSGNLEIHSEIPLPPVPIIKKPEDDFPELDNQKPEEAVSEQLGSLSRLQEDAP
jgi:hypothetical protein